MMKAQPSPLEQAAGKLIGGYMPQGVGTQLAGTQQGGGVIPQGTQPRLKGMTVGGMNFEIPQTEEEKQKDIEGKAQESQAKELAKGIPAGQTGLYTLAQESLKEISDVKKMLFPNGTPESFRRDIAMSSTMPMPLSEKGQKVKRKMTTSLAGRQLIQTGVAARPEETEALRKSFMANVLSNPEAAYEALNQLQNFYQTYRTNLETRGIKQKGLNQSSQDATESKSFKNLWE